MSVQLASGWYNQQIERVAENDIASSAPAVEHDHQLERVHD
jgi:hypothetical protein